MKKYNLSEKYFSNYSADFIFCVSANGDYDKEKLVLKACFKIADEIFKSASEGVFSTSVELNKIVPQMFECAHGYEDEDLNNKLHALKRIWKDMGYKVKIIIREEHEDKFENPCMNYYGRKITATMELNWSNPKKSQKIYCDWGKDPYFEEEQRKKMEEFIERNKEVTNNESK